MGWIYWFAVVTLIGALIGQAKGRTAAGAVLGFLLGPIGWLLVAIGPNQKPKCPECGGEITPGARKCKNCGSVLSEPTSPRTEVVADAAPQTPIVAAPVDAADAAVSCETSGSVRGEPASAVTPATDFEQAMAAAREKAKQAQANLAAGEVRLG